MESLADILHESLLRLREQEIILDAAVRELSGKPADGKDCDVICRGIFLQLFLAEKLLGHGLLREELRKGLGRHYFLGMFFLNIFRVHFL